MITFKRLARRSTLLAFALAFGGSLAIPALYGSTASAASIMPASRNVTPASDLVNTNVNNALGTAYNPGDAGNGAKTKYTVSFKATSNDAVNMGSIALFFCTTPFAGTTCAEPGGAGGMDLTHVATGTVAGAAGTGWALDTTTVANAGYFVTPTCGGSSPFRLYCALFKATAAGATTAGTTVTLTLSSSISGTDYVINPQTPSTYYVRIVTFSDNAYTAGNLNDEGAAAFAIISATIDITSKVQEQLTFSVGTAGNAPGGSCAALGGGGNLNVGDGNGALSTTVLYDNHSYWRVYTNANNGTVIQYAGDTLKTTTGYAITAKAALGTLSPGTENFGLGLDSGDTTPAGAGTGYTLSTLNTYGSYGSAQGAIGSAQVILNTASVNAPITMASQSAAGPISCETGSVRYIATAGTTTKPGIYKTSFTYIASPTF